jgi:Holliday junction DNA helicase RuvA
MITRITGIVNRVLDEEVRLQVGPYERQVLVTDVVRRQLQQKVGQEVTLCTTEYLEGNQMSNRLVPRLIGFLSEAEQEFFELFCTVEKIGTRKAMRAMARPVHEIASAIQRQDKKWLSTLPGIGTQTADQIIATLHRKVTRFTVPADATADRPTTEAAAISGTLLDDLYKALLSLGHSPSDARNKLDRLVNSGQQFQTIEQALVAIYQSG